MSIFRVISNLFRFNRTNWKAVALCFFAALVFWLFSALNKNHTTNISFPVHFEFDTERFVAISLPQHANLNVSGNGWDLLRKSLGLRLPVLNVPLEKPTEVKKIPGATFTALASVQLGSLQINYLVGDTLDLEIDLKDSHKFKLVADLGRISYKTGFGRISPVVILPDSVEIVGPKSILHHISDSIVLTLPQNKLSDHFRDEVEVVVQDGELLKRDPPVVEVHFEVGEIEEVKLKLPLKILKKPEQWRLESQPDSIVCVIAIPKNSGHEILDSNPVRAVINLSSFKKGESMLSPHVEGLPPLAHVVRIDSVFVKLN